MREETWCKNTLLIKVTAMFHILSSLPSNSDSQEMKWKPLWAKWKISSWARTLTHKHCMCTHPDRHTFSQVTNSCKAWMWKPGVLEENILLLQKHFWWNMWMRAHRNVSYFLTHTVTARYTPSTQREHTCTHTGLYARKRQTSLAWMGLACKVMWQFLRAQQGWVVVVFLIQGLWFKVIKNEQSLRKTLRCSAVPQSACACLCARRVGTACHWRQFYNVRWHKSQGWQQQMEE